ncbi:hypothetical protein AB1Y20_021468 [Prymnesium parvum]|uniref:Lipase maturation factor n=1 Tax=Prymnesium parvum TaxID=97485 RepID=A0AB34JKP0_PRYPA
MITAYARLWCLNQLAPFADKGLAAIGLLGAAGPVDSRPICTLDWTLRLPLVLLNLSFCSVPTLLAAHVANVLLFCWWLPIVWDHMSWAVVIELTFIACTLCSARGTVTELFLGCARVQMVSLYFVAAFWKLTSSFLDYRTSCATVLVAELLTALFPEPWLPAGGVVSVLLLRAAPMLTVILEFAVSLLLAFAPRLGVLLGMSFHLAVNVLPLNYAGGFSLQCIARYGVFMPASVAAALREGAQLGTWAAVHVVLASAGVAACNYFRGGVDAHFVACAFLASLYARALSLEEHKVCDDVLPPALVGKFSRVCAGLFAIGWGILPPILGLQNMAALTMYANLKHWGGSNHLLVPTNVLYERWSFRESQSTVARLWDQFDGRTIVRVDRAESVVLASLSPADSTELLPVRARNLMREAGASARYFGAYYSRIYFGEQRAVWPVGDAGTSYTIPLFPASNSDPEMEIHCSA